MYYNRMQILFCQCSHFDQILFKWIVLIKAQYQCDISISSIVSVVNIKWILFHFFSLLLPFFSWCSVHKNALFNLHALIDIKWCAKHCRHFGWLIVFTLDSSAPLPLNWWNSNNFSSQLHCQNNFNQNSIFVQILSTA